MIATAITVVLCLVGVATLAAVALAAVALHSIRWPNLSCNCGRWTLDEDSGVVLPLLDHDMIHDRNLCMPPAEYIHQPEGGPV